MRVIDEPLGDERVHERFERRRGAPVVEEVGPELVEHRLVRQLGQGRGAFEGISRSSATWPSGSMVAKSWPDAFTKIAGTRLPRIVVWVVLTDVLPPPWRTREGSAPSRRLV